MLEIVVDHEAHERCAIHDQTLFVGLSTQISFGFPCEGGVHAEKAAIIIGIHEHGIKRRSILFASANGLFAAHLLLCFLGNLNGGDRSIEELVVYAFETVFDATFKFREKSHGCSPHITRAIQHRTINILP